MVSAEGDKKGKVPNLNMFDVEEHKEGEDDAKSQIVTPDVKLAIVAGKRNYKDRDGQIYIDIDPALENVEVVRQGLLLLGYNPEHIIIMENVTYKQIDDKFGEWIKLLKNNKRSRKPVNIFITFYFAGHGVTSEKNFE
jgi:hypothetical protein